MTRIGRVGRGRRRLDREAPSHARARLRAAERIDGPLDPTEAAWLDRHLSACASCAAVAGAYEADRTALRRLRTVPLDPPRDLWARTAAGIERESRARPATGRSGRRSSRRSLPALGVLSGIAVIAVVIGATALSGGLVPGLPATGVIPAASASTVAEATQAVAGPTPMVVGAGDVRWVGAADNGAYAYNSAPVAEVCSHDQKPDCAPVRDKHAKPVAISARPRSIIQSPQRNQAVVVGTDAAGGDSVTVIALPTADATPAASATPGASPTIVPTSSPSAAATAAPTATSSTVPSPSVQVTSSQTPSVASATPASEPPVTQVPASSSPATASSSSQPSTSEPPATQSPATQPPASPSPATQPPASAPPATEAPVSPPPPSVPPVSFPPATGTPAPSAAAALAIVSGVTVVGQGASYSPDGLWFAFSARPSDDSAGPDIYVWRVGDAKARAVTKDHISVFASWVGARMLGSKPGTTGPLTGAVAAKSFFIDPVTGTETAITGGLWRPVVDPTGRWDVAWEGTVQAGAQSHTVVPAGGSLVLRPFLANVGPDLSQANPAVITDGAAPEFDVRWDVTGSWLAVWIADPDAGSFGRLSLIHVDPATGHIDRPTGAPQDVAALPGFSIADGRLAWATPPGQGGEGSRVQIVAWTAESVGSVETAPERDVVVIH